MAGSVSKNIEFIISAEDKFSKTFTKLIDFMKTPEGILVGIAAGGLAVTAVLEKLTSQVAESYEKVAQTADKLGLTTEALSGLQYAAHQAGVESNTFDMALQRMVRRTAEAAKGMGEATGALNELGLSAASLNQMSPDEQLIAIADALEKIPNEADKVRLAFKLFDSEGVALLQMFKEGTDEMQRFREEAAQLGIVVSEEAAEAARDYAEANKRFKASWEGLKNKIGEEFLGPGADALDMMASMVGDLKDLVEVLGRFKNAVADTTSETADGLEEWVDRTSETIGKAINDWDPWIFRITGLTEYHRQLWAEQEKLGKQQALIAQQSQMVAAAAKGEEASLKDLQNAYAALYGYVDEEAVKGFEINLKVNSTALKTISDQLKELQSSIEGTSGDGLGSEIDRSTINVVDLQNEMGALKQRAEEITLSGINSDYAVSEIERISDQMQGVKEKLAVLAEPKLKLEALEADFKLAEGGFTEVRTFISQPVKMSVDTNPALAAIFGLEQQIRNLDGQKITVYVEAQAGSGGVSSETVAEIDRQLAESIKRGGSAVGAALTE